MKNKTNLGKHGLHFLHWSQKHPIGKIPYGVAKEGAGENRIPFTHFANSVPVYLVFLDLLKKSQRASANVLDLGCGTGRNISYVKESLNRAHWNFYGIDYSASCIGYARSQYKIQGVNFVQHDGSKLPYPDATFDYLVSSHVMEHIKENDQPFFVGEIARILKPGATAVIGEPNRKYCQDLFIKNPKETKKYRLVQPHEHEHYASDLRKLYQNSGFSQYKIWQTINPISRELFMQSVATLKPSKDKWKNMIFELYGFARRNHYLQDLMARLGTEMIIRRMGVEYDDLIRATELWEFDRPDNGDNFIVVAKK